MRAWRVPGLCTLSLLALALLLGACGSTARQRAAPERGNPVADLEPAQRPTSTPRRSATPRPADTAQPVEPGMSRRLPLPLGSEVRPHTLSVRVSSVLRGAEAWQLLAETNRFNNPPPAGYEYLLASVQVVNRSSQAQDLVSTLDLRLTGDRNSLYHRSALVAPRPLGRNLAPQARLEGQLAFQIAADEDDLIFRISEHFTAEKPRVFFVAASEGASVTPNRALLRIRPTSFGTQRSEPAPLGQTITTAAWQVTVLEVVRGLHAAALAAGANQFNDPPAEGMEYVAVRVRARYIDTAEPDDPVLINGSSMSITGERHVVYKRPSLVDPEPQLDAFLFPGGEVEGWEILSVAQGEQQLVLIFEPFLASSDEVRFLALE